MATELNSEREITCSHCNGAGFVKLTGVYADTLRMLQKEPVVYLDRSDTPVCESRHYCNKEIFALEKELRQPTVEEIRNALRTRDITTVEAEFLLAELDRLKAENERLRGDVEDREREIGSLIEQLNEVLDKREIGECPGCGAHTFKAHGVFNCAARCGWEDGMALLP